MKLKLLTIFFFTTTLFFGQNTIVTIQDESIFVCSGFFYDSEARNNGNYDDNENYTITLYPAVSNMKLKLIFNSFSTQNNYDGMMIYNGNSTTAPLISSGLSAGLDPITCPAGAWRGNGSPGTIISTATDGSLTIVFKSNSDTRRPGWEASISLVGNSCNSSYVDFGGNNFDYWNNVNDQITLYPSNNSEKVQIVFTSFSTESNFDGMMIYDGNSTTAPLISSGLPAGLDPITCPAGAWRGSGSPGAITSTATDGSLTIVFKSDDSIVSAGWTANINCIINPPSSISISETSGLANNDGTICSEASTTLTANGAIGTVYWYTNSCGGTQIGTGNSITVAPTTTTTYYARNNNNGSWSSCVTSTVSVTPSPTNVNAGNDVSICIGSSTQLSGSSTPLLLCTTISTLTNTTNYSIPDNDTSGINSIINIPSSCGLAAEIQSVKVNINHFWVNDLDITLIAPNGSTIDLSSDNGVSGDNYIDTIFTPNGPTSISSGIPPFTGNYTPEQPFSNLTGSAVGNWTLKVVDDLSGDIGTLVNWSITVKTSQNTTATYSWSPTTGLSNPNIANPTASPTTTTTYTMTATANGCSASDSVVITVFPTLNAGAHNTSALNQCIGFNPAALTFTTTPSGGNGNYTYQWQLNTVDILNATSNSYDPNPILIAGVYSYRCKVTDGCGNSVYTAPKIITIVADPNEPSCLKSPNLPSVCVGTSLTLQNCIYGTESGVLCPLEYSYSIDAGVNWSATSTIVPNFSATGTTNLIRVRVSNCGSCNASSWMVYSWNIYPTPSTTNINHN